MLTQPAQPKRKFLSLIRKKEFLSSVFLKTGENIYDYSWLSQVDELINSKDVPLHLIGLFTDICDSCRGGMLIREFESLYGKHINLINVLAILHKKFSRKDIKILRSQLQINLPIYLASPELDQEWSRLIMEYGESEVSELAILTDHYGKILTIYYPKSSFSNFISFIHSQISEYRKAHNE